MSTDVEVLLEIRAGILFPELECMCWFRGRDGRSGKIVVIEPTEPMNPWELEPRSFQGSDVVVSSENVGRVAQALQSIDAFDQRPLLAMSIDDESKWWARLAFEFRLGPRRTTGEIAVGRSGLVGPDAKRLRELVALLYALGHSRTRWSDLVTGNPNAV